MENNEEGFSRVKVAAISMKPEKWNKEANASKMEKLFTRAANLDAQVALITEACLEGYVVMDAIKDPALSARVLQISEPRNGKYIQRFMELAKSLGICLCLGFAERVDEDAYNSAMFIDNEGVICGVHHKMQFAEGYHESWNFNRLGSQVRAFDTPFGRAGFLICNDRWDRSLGRALVLDGARTIYIPAYGSKRLRQDRAVLALARDNGVPVVEANVGLNLIVSRGEIVARQKGNDRITVADIDIPSLPSKDLVEKIESVFLSSRENLMEKKYAETMASLKRRSSLSRKKIRR